MDPQPVAQLKQLALVTPSVPVEVPAVETRRVADVIVQTLKELGVDTFYGIPGGAICPIYDALLDQPSMRVINTRHETGAAYSYLPRSLPTSAVIHDSVFDRMLRALPVYAPASLYRLNGELVRMRAEIETETTKLAESGSIDGDELREIHDRSKQHLILMKWSAYLDSSLADGVALRERLTPAKELGNSARRRDSVGVGAVRAG